MLQKFFAAILRILLRLRYRIKITGLDKLKNAQSAFILPNHPAEIDPIILLFNLTKVASVRPVVLEEYYYATGARRLMKWLRAIAIPDMAYDAGAYKQKRIQNALDEVIRSLEKRDNILFYPAGGLSSGGFERLGGKSGVYLVLRKCPLAKVFLVRTQGLNGSAFSKALTGRSPNFTKVLRSSILTLLRNFIFFTPRREVTVTIEEAPADFPRGSEVVTLNRWLEHWYNKNGADHLKLISRSFWRKDLPHVVSISKPEIEAQNIPQPIQEKVNKFISSLAGIAEEKISPTSRLGDDLGIDSLNMVEIVQWLEDQFAVADVDFGELVTVGDISRAALSQNREIAIEDVLPTPSKKWGSLSAKRPDPTLAPGNTIPEAFLHCASTMRKFPAVADQRSGVVSWRRFKIGVLTLAAKIKEMPGERIGILLPASVAATMTVIAVLLAKKTPVMLNWTSGRENVRHAFKSAGVECSLTGLTFLDRVDADLTFLEQQFVFLERIREQIPLSKKLVAIFQSMLSAKRLTKHLSLDQLSPDTPAVILYTSGSETAPKGVPLSHRNILANIRGGLEVVRLKSQDVLCGILPPFHSFGFTITTIIPAVTGVRAVYWPNPNESRKIAQIITSWGATHIAGTPAFLSSILRAGDTEKFRTLRLLIVGAEKAPASLFEMVTKITPEATLIEGYGITECSPIVTANRVGEPPAGVGRPLSGVELLIIHPDTHQPLTEGKTGLVLIRGESVFPGYLDPSRNPFLEVDGRLWYNSGDLGYVKDQQLYLVGRLKRFVKIGGEMVSLPALEEALQKRWPAQEEGPNLAVVGFEYEDGKRSSLFLATTEEIKLEEANEVLMQSGFPYLVKLSSVIKLPTLPLLGSGKIDIRNIEQQVKTHIGQA